MTTSMDYQEFIRRKSLTTDPVGFDVHEDDLVCHLFDFQRDIVRWALRRGRAAIFADCGMGKTPMQLEWARQVVARTGHKVLILAPLAVAQQTVREAEKFSVDCPIQYLRSQDQVTDGITVTNYEMLHAFDPEQFGAVVIDESSIIKAFDGKTRNQIIAAFQRTPYRLACTATPAPNDFMELGNHSEFLGIMTRSEMLSMFFVHDAADTQTWRIKGHAQDVFWRWMCGWSCMIRRPSDLGYDDATFVLPTLNMQHHEVEADQTQAIEAGMLFAMEARTLSERRNARRASMQARVDAAVRLVEGSDRQWLVWCDLNAEGDAIERAIDGAVQVAGADSNDQKEQRLIGFLDGRHRVMVSKSSIFGFGLNLQCCSDIIFVGLSDSYEQFYQAIRRCWRFGQTRQVNCHIITSQLEGAVVENIKRKEADAQRMAAAMVGHMRTEMRRAIRGTARDVVEYNPTVQMTVPAWIGVDP